MIRRIFAALAIGAVALSGAAAQAHKDYNADGNNTSTKRCDTWYRTGHESGTTGNKSSDHHTSDFDNGEVAPGVYLHNHTGHYVVRHDAFYVEVIGGGGYAREGNQGGAVQAEVDPAAGAPDADAHVDFFAGTNGAMHAENACASVADNKVGNQGTQP